MKLYLQPDGVLYEHANSPIPTISGPLLLHLQHDKTYLRNQHILYESKKDIWSSIAVPLYSGILNYNKL